MKYWRSFIRPPAPAAHFDDRQDQELRQLLSDASRQILLHSKLNIPTLITITVDVERVPQ